MYMASLKVLIVDARPMYQMKFRDGVDVTTYFEADELTLKCIFCSASNLS